MEARQVTSVYGEVSSLPTPVCADVREQQQQQQEEDIRVFTVTAGWSQTDAVRASRLCYSQQWTLISASGDQRAVRTVLPPGPCVPLPAELLSGLSPVGGLRAVVLDSGGHQLLEIWDHRGLRKCLNLTALNKHGGVYDDAHFGGLSWSECESKLLYVAEKLKNTNESARGKVYDTRTRAHGRSNAILHVYKQDRSVYCDDWGEALTNRSTPAVCVVGLHSGSADVLPGVPADVSPGQALWAPGGQSVFFIGWYHEPFRLGLKFCSNRRSALFQLSMDGHCERLTGDNLSVSCPRLSPDGSTLVYLQGQVFGPHNQCLSLQQLDVNSRKTSTLLDVVRRPQSDGFAGVYEALASSCWSADGRRVVFSSACRNRKDLFMVDRGSKKVSPLSCGLVDATKIYGSWKLLTIQKDLMIVCCSSPNTPPTMLVAFLPSASEAVTWLPLQEPMMTFDFLWTVLDVEPPPEEDNANYLNYRGSTGFGQDGILSLIGHIGSQDVKDVQRAVLAALDSDTTLDPGRVAAIGGSHGGFLSCHLVARYPDFYKACAARNPVINAATLLGTSDIVDWRYTCVGLQYSYNQTPTAEALAAMLEKSPIIHAAQIKAPVLLMLGGRDRRVSPYQGLELYKALKSRAAPVRLLWFAEDGHSLSRVDTQAQCFLNVALWLQQHL
ncbi:S9 family peptidase isoform X8 [Phycodurus eques]|uniref:S9 family peptidase isoform X8 n=1 Tax=Phycodurus eques TaxID=693459 RepID=UPI002ACE43F4|nr:S9 family peptidase isoform X8 [Phycodurus eques]